jgi:hypothetical protein
MARARTIKPRFFTNETLGELTPLARLLFAGLWCLADREGRLEDRPRRIKTETLPYDDCDVDELLTGLHDKQFILRYLVNGEPYIQILAWKKHQHPHVKEQASTIPAPDMHGASMVQGDVLHGASMVQGDVLHGACTGISGTSPSLYLLPITCIDTPVPSDQTDSSNGSSVSEKSVDLTVFDGEEPLDYYERHFRGEWHSDTWRHFPRYVNTSEKLGAFAKNLPLWMRTRKYRDGFGTNSVKFLSSGIWLKPPSRELMGDAPRASPQATPEIPPYNPPWLKEAPGDDA